MFTTQVYPGLQLHFAVVEGFHPALLLMVAGNRNLSVLQRLCCEKDFSVLYSPAVFSWKGW